MRRRAESSDRVSACLLARSALGLRHVVAVRPLYGSSDHLLSSGLLGTEVTWTMSGEQKGLWGVIGRLYPMDKLIGKDFEKGLARLKAVAESD